MATYKTLVSASLRDAFSYLYRKFKKSFLRSFDKLLFIFSIKLGGGDYMTYYQGKKNERKYKRMTVLTADCKLAFVVADNKAAEFNKKTKNLKIDKKNKALMEKVTKQIRMDNANE